MAKKIAVVHDFCFQYGGAEKVVEKFLMMFPEADLVTSIFVPSKFATSKILTDHYESGKIKTTWLNLIFNANQGILLKYFKHFFWLYPLVMRFVVLRGYDLILISSTDCGKQIRFDNCPKIIHYCHTPTRYLHNLIAPEDQKISNIQKCVMPFFVFLLRKLDFSAVRYLNSKNTTWVGNSKFVQGLIHSVYNTKAELVYPPIELDKFNIISRDIKTLEPFYLSHGRISFHKRIDLAIEAFLNLGLRLKISGTSALQSEMDSLQLLIDQAVAKDPNKSGLIELLGRTTDRQIAELIGGCIAFVFPGKEDFGIAPIEMLAAGVPLIAFEAGGALEYVIEGHNGIFFKEATSLSLEVAIQEFEQKFTQNSFDISVIKLTSIQFGEQEFEKKIKALI